MRFCCQSLAWQGRGQFRVHEVGGGRRRWASSGLFACLSAYLYVLTCDLWPLCAAGFSLNNQLHQVLWLATANLISPSTLTTSWAAWCVWRPCLVSRRSPESQMFPSSSSSSSCPFPLCRSFQRSGERRVGNHRAQPDGGTIFIINHTAILTQCWSRLHLLVTLSN